jgi:hypothetical protein
MKMFSFIMLKGESGMGSEVLYGHRNSFLESEFCVNGISDLIDDCQIKNIN